jgi:hypothetical protein
MISPIDYALSINAFLLFLRLFGADDHDVANLLISQYRSFCIDGIDAMSDRLLGLGDIIIVELRLMSATWTCLIFCLILVG